MKCFCIALAAIASCLWVWMPLAHTSQVRPVPDFDQNGTVDFPDFLLFVNKFGSKQSDERYEDRFDLDGNGVIDFSDFLSFVNDFGKISLGGGDENDVNIPDANLRAVIADSLGKGRDEAITRAEMATLTRFEAEDANIRDLTGLQFAANLTELWLHNNAITDLSALCDLTKLTDLVLYNNAFSDISALSNMTNMSHLNLSHNNVLDISVLAKMTNMTYLWLSNNTISDISALAGLTNLIRLNLHANNISDLSVLANLANLTQLEISKNAITDISALAGLTNLIRLDMSGTSVRELSALSNLTNLTQLELSQNAITDISALSNLANLIHLNLDNNCLSDLSPLVANTGFGNGVEVDVRKNPLSAESLNTHIPTLQSRGVDVQFDNQPVLECVPILPQNLSVDAGSSHTLQSNYLYVDHQGINPRGLNWGLVAVGVCRF